MKRIVLVMFIVASSGWTSFAQMDAAPVAPLPSPPPADGVEITPRLITQLAEEARTNNPALLAADERARAAAANARSIRVWEDPMFRVGGMAAETMMRAEEGDLLYGVEQKLPLFGKPQAERRVAQEETRVEEADAEFRFQQVRRDLALAMFRTALAEHVVDIGRQDLDWLKKLVEVAERRYETGDATQLDVLRLRNEQSLRATRLETDAAMLRQEHVTLNRLLNRPFDHAWPVLRLPPVAPAVPFSEYLMELAMQGEPELAMRRQQWIQAEASVNAARRERYPDISVGAEARNYTESGDFRQAMFMLNFSLPLVNRGSYSAAIRREQARARSVQLDLADATLALRNEIHELTVRIDAVRREALVYERDILPRSATALESARAAWETGRGMMIDLLDARRMLLDAQLMHARAVSGQYQALSDLVLCCGLGDLEMLYLITAPPEDRSAK